ncbi:MAG: TonB-dependent receptor [Candidatus Neomarinimicrobiota bacterium]
MARSRLSSFLGGAFFQICLFSGTLLGQIIVSGRITESVSQSPLEGVNIQVVDTYDGGTTDNLGNFEISTSSNYPFSLRITHIGFESQTLLVTDDQTLTIELVQAIIESESITVEGRRTRVEADVTAPVELITLKDIEATAARDVNELLRPLPSIRIETQPYGKQTINIQGSNADEVAILLDGIPLNDAYTGTADLSAIDLNDLEQLEVIKGGGSVLHARGAFGGVINLTTRKPYKNQISFLRGVGLTDDSDQDLSVSGSGRLGPVAVGGRFSGKSRLYDGRTLFTSLYGIGSGALYLPYGDLTAKRYYLGNTLEYPSGAIAQSDSTIFTSANYSGSIAGLETWNLSAGQRLWTWKDNFFTNRQSDLRDISNMYRLSKGFDRGGFTGTIQLDAENQRYHGKTTVFMPLLRMNKVDDARLDRKVISMSAVVKLINKSDATFIENTVWEAGYRQDGIATSHSHITDLASTSTSDNSLLNNESIERSMNDRARVIRIGFMVEGRTISREYDLFFSQGSNRRPPTLSDLFRYYSAEPEYQETPLVTEYFNSTNIGLRAKMLDNGEITSISWVEYKLELFNNSYLEKIGYRPVPDGPPVPFNRGTALTRGYEITGKIALWEERLSILGGYQHVSLSDPLVFPNKPEYRLLFQADVQIPWLILRFDYQKEGPQYIIVNGWLATNNASRESANLSMTLRGKLWRFNWSVAYTVRNLFNEDPPKTDSIDNLAVPFQYYDAHRELITVRIGL